MIAQSVFEVVFGLLGLLLLGIVYTYMDKLEKVGCPCAEHPHAKFIKTYSLFAIIFLGFLIVVPATFLTGMLGDVFGFALMAVKILFSIATIVFYIYVIQYVQYLMREKCRCSEDMRREVMYLWSILMIAILSTLVVVPMFGILRSASIGSAMNKFERGVKGAPRIIMSAAVNPAKSFKKASGKISGVFRK